MQLTVKDIVASAIKLPVDTNGNPRYYVPVFLFQDKNGHFFRPKFADKYRGKKFGPGWVFQSFCLESDLFYAIEDFV